MVSQCRNACLAAQRWLEKQAPDSLLGICDQMQIPNSGQANSSAPLRQAFCFESWHQHIRGNVVSEHQRRLVVSFMLNNCGRSHGPDDNDECIDAEKEKPDPATFSNACNVASIHAVLQRMVEKQNGSTTSENDLSSSTHTALQLGNNLWGPMTRPWPNTELQCSHVY